MLDYGKKSKLLINSWIKLKMRIKLWWIRLKRKHKSKNSKKMKKEESLNWKIKHTLITGKIYIKIL